MKQLKFILFLLPCIFMLFSCDAQSVGSSKRKEITLNTTSNLEKLTELIEKKAAGNESFKHLQARMDKLGLLLFGCLNELESEIYYGANDREILQKYYDEVENYNALLQQAQQIEDPDSLSSILTFIEEDVSLKYDLQNTDPEKRKASLVNVKVRVLDPGGDKEQSGYLVFVKPELSLDPRHIEAFNPTNNALKEISPGKKLIWIEKNGKRIEQRKTGIRKSSETVLVDFVLNQ